MAPDPIFGFVQFEFGFLLGPSDGRYLARSDPQAQAEVVLVLTTLGAPARSWVRGRRGTTTKEAGPEPVPTNRATVVRTEPFPTLGHAESWLSAVRDQDTRRDEELERAQDLLNHALYAYRIASADPYARDVSADQALVTRIGFGSGDHAVAGQFQQAWEPPRAEHRFKLLDPFRPSMEAPNERFAALLSGREPALACEELVLRARLDLNAGRPREAALQARIALETLLAELPKLSGNRRGDLDADREQISTAANTALRSELSEQLVETVGASVGRMESALRAHRLSSAT